jgi:hypothetical protein
MLLCFAMDHTCTVMAVMAAHLLMQTSDVQGDTKVDGRQGGQEGQGAISLPGPVDAGEQSAATVW